MELDLDGTEMLGDSKSENYLLHTLVAFIWEGKRKDMVLKDQSIAPSLPMPIKSSQKFQGAPQSCIPPGVGSFAIPGDVISTYFLITED